MVIFIYGPDTFRSRQKLNEIIAQHKEIHRSGLNLKLFTGKNLSFKDFQAEFSSFSMFAEKKLLVLTDVFSNKDFKEKFLKDAKKFIDSEDLILFYEESAVPVSDKLFKLLKKSGKSQEFKLLNGVNLKNWIKKEAEKSGAKMSPMAVDKLTDFAGNDTWRIYNEIQKLANYRKDREIQPKDVELLVKPEIETDIFRTIDAIALKNKSLALELLHEHLAKGENALYLLSMINFQFRNLLVVKDLIEKNQPYYVLAQKTQLHPFVIQKSWSQAQKFSLTELKKIYRKIFQADLDIKTGKTEPVAALDLLITEL